MPCKYVTSVTNNKIKTEEKDEESNFNVTGWKMF